jgi:hypothetical protein
MSGIAPRIDTIESQVAVAGVTYIGNASGESGTTGYTVYSERKTFTVTIATPGVFTVTAHGYSDGDAVSLSTTGALPTGLAANTVYYVVNKATNTFNLSTTLGGSAIATSGTQSGVHTIGPVVAHVGTGGVAAGTTFTVSNINPLRGLQSFVFSKDAANRMGQGASYNFTIDRADLAKVLTVGFEYQVNSGTLNDGDVRVYLVQDPNGVPSIIQPAGLTVLGATAGVKMRHVATFQSDFTAREYRLCIHVASTSVSAWSLGVDSISVGPQAKLYGAPITDWVSARAVPALVGSTTNPTTSSSAVKYRRIGDSYEISWYYSISTAGSGEYRFQLPDGLTIDTAKLSQAFTSNSGSGRAYDLSTGINYNLAPRTVAGVTTYITLCADNVAVGGVIGSAAHVVFAAGDEIWVTVILPIAGLSSSVQMSNDTETRVVAMRAYTTNAQTPLANASSAVIINYTTAFDTHAAFNPTTGIYTVPVSGYYRISSNITTAAIAYTTGTGRIFQLAVSGTNNAALSTTPVQASVTTYLSSAGSTTFLYKAGDTISLTMANYTGTTVTLDAGAADNWLSIERLSGPATIAASETVTAKYWATASQTISAATRANYDGKIYDTHNAVTTGASWVFTAPISGRYRTSVFFNNSAAVTGNPYIDLYIDGSAYQGIVSIYGLAGVGTGSSTVYLNAGQTIQIRASASYPMIGAATISNASRPSYIDIERIGN